MKKLLSFFSLLYTFTLLHGQKVPSYYGVKSHYGFIIAHSPELKPISQTNPYGIQLEYSWLKTSDKAWKTCFCYGRSGFSFAYFNYLIYFVEPYFTYKGPLKFSLRGSVGLTYLNKTFNEQTNPENLLFSTNLSFYIALSLHLNYHISDTYAINLSGNYNHISNGGQKQPNKGMNFPTFSIGVDKIINNTELKKKPKSLKSYTTSFRYYSGTFASLRSSDREAEATNHLLIGIVGGLLKPISGINGLNAGVELWYDYSDREIAKQREINDNAFSSAITAGHHFSIGNFYFLQQFGFYLTRPKNIQKNWLYQRYSFWYSIGRSKRWTIGASLIAYGKVADHMDGRLVYFLN